MNILFVVNAIIVNIQIKHIRNAVIVMVINVGVWVSIIDFFLIIDSITIIIVIFCIIYTVIVMVSRRFINNIRDAIIIIIGI